jgi:opacity protein-like surface antigen
MKKLIVLCIIILPISLLAQTAENDSLKRKNAVLFSFNGLNLNAFDNGIGWKRWLSDNIAINSKLEILISKEKKQSSDVLNGSENSKYNLELTFGLERHFHRANSLSPYIGGQLGIGYERIENKILPMTFSFMGPYYLYDIETKSGSVSLQMVLGVEYYLKENISLSGQYGIGGHYGFGTEKTQSNTANGEQDISELQFGIRSSSLILSIYL